MRLRIFAVVGVCLLFVNSCGPKKQSSIALESGDYSKAVVLLKQELAADSSNADLWRRVGGAYAHLNQLDSAITAYGKALTLGGSTGETRRELAELYVRRARKYREEKAYRRALEDLDAAEKIEPGAFTSAYERGLTYLKAGYLFKAREAFQIAQNRSSNDPRVAEHLALIDQRMKEAQALFEKGKALYDKEKWEAAAKALEQATQVNVEHREARYYLHMARGRRLYKKGSVAALWDAITEYGYAANLRPESGEPLYYMGLAYEKKDRNDYTMPVEVYQKVVELDPESEYAKKAHERITYLTNLKTKLEKFWGKKRKE